MSAWATFAKVILEPIIGGLPGFFMNRMYPSSRLENCFEVDLRSAGGLAVLNTSPPSLAGNLRMTNHLPFEVIVERCCFDIWFGQPNAEVSLKESLTIPKHSTNNGVYFRAQLSDVQFAQAKQLLDHPTFGYVYLDGVAECKVGFTKFKKRIYIERNNHDIVSMAHYRVAPTFDEPAATSTAAPPENKDVPVAH